jgi:hypothetical protein
VVELCQIGYVLFTGCDHAHLLLDVVERIRGVDREADKDDMGIWVRQWTETVVVFLTRCIP